MLGAVNSCRYRHPLVNSTPRHVTRPGILTLAFFGFIPWTSPTRPLAWSLFDTFYSGLFSWFGNVASASSSAPADGSDSFERRSFDDSVEGFPGKASGLWPDMADYIIPIRTVAMEKIGRLYVSPCLQGLRVLPGCSRLVSANTTTSHITEVFSITVGLLAP